MTTVLATIGVGLGLARLLLFVALHLVHSNYTIVEHAFSDYAVGRTKRLSAITTWVTAALWLVLAATAVSAYPTWSHLVGVTIGLVILAAIFVVLPFLPTDVEGQAATTIGRLHLVTAVAWFAISYACMDEFVDLLRPTSNPPLDAVLVTTNWTALVALVLLIAAFVIRPVRRYAFGITERVFLLSVTVFYTAVPLSILTN